MILNVYNFRDERINEFGTPVFTLQTPDQVAATYEKTVRELQAKIARLSDINLNAPELGQLVMKSASLKDTVVYHVGTFDSVTGVISSIEPVLVARLGDFYVGA